MTEQPNDEELRKLLKPNPTIEQVIDIIRTTFLTDGAAIQLVKELDSYDDRNYWISINNTYYLLKVHNGVESKDLAQRMLMTAHNDDDNYKQSVIHLQNAIMMHLNQHGITTNQPIQPTTSPKTPASIHTLPVVASDQLPCSLVVRLLSWVPGRPMSSFPMIPIEALADAGRFLGRLSSCLSSLNSDELIASKRWHQWDGKNTSALEPFVKYIENDQRRKMVESVIKTFQKELIDSGEADSFQTSLIHGDFNDANFLLDDNFCVSGVLDFGDSVESWRILDLSVAMAYAMLTVYGKGGRSLSAAAAMLRGYNGVSPLTAVERKHLLLLVAVRLSCSVTLGAFSYKQNPGNEYLLLHSVPAWEALGLIWGTDLERRIIMKKTIHDLFDCACSKTGLPEDGGDTTTSSSTSAVIDCSDLAFPDPSLVDPIANIRNNNRNDS